MTDPDRDIVLQRAERKRLKIEYSALFDDLTALLYQLDPVGLNYGINPDEYEPEVGTILPRVMELETASEIASIIREEFEVWFGTGTRVESATYEELGTEVLVVLDRCRSSS